MNRTFALFATTVAILSIGFFAIGTAAVSRAEEPLKLDVWADLAPNETSRDTGTAQPSKGEAKPIERVSGVRRPTLDVYPAKNNVSGTAVIILPGGGFGYVVPNLEGSEAAEWLNEIGITAFVLRYRTKEAAEPGEPLWQRPLQDAQRAVRLVRLNADRWQLNPSRVGVLGSPPAVKLHRFCTPARMLLTRVLTMLTNLTSNPRSRC
jgi:acetyl esterase/lipase